MRWTSDLFFSLLTGLLVLVGSCPLGAAPPTDRELAEHLVQDAGFAGGLCAVLGTDDGGLPLAIARAGNLLVHVQEPRTDAVDRARKTCNTDGLWGRRIVVERGPLGALPYADNTVDLLVAAQLTPADLADLNPTEILRVLRPRGKAVLGSRAEMTGGVSQDQLKQRFPESAVAQDRFGVWVGLTKPVPPGTDNWSHWQHGPDNNPLSTDTVIKAPYLVQWLGEPYFVAMPTVTTAAGGRTFLAIGHTAHHQWEWPTLYTLIARNGYNGQVLWTRKLPEGYLVHRSAFIATDEVFYLIDGDRALCLDAETGAERGEIRFPGSTEKWEWMALADGRLYVLAGAGSSVQTLKMRNNWGGWSWEQLGKEYLETRVPFGWGTTLTAWDLKANKVLWTHREKEYDSRAMAVGDGKVFFYGPEIGIGCLEGATGSVLWRNTDQKTRDLIEQPGESDLTSHPGFRSTCYALYTPQALVYQAQTRNNVVAVSPADGKFLWQRKKVTRDPNLLYADGLIVGAIGAWGDHVTVDPLTGNVVKSLRFTKVGCLRLTGCPDSFFVRGEGVGRYDRLTGKLIVDSAMRSGCSDGAVPANGLLYLSPWMCSCNLSLVGAGAMCSAGDSRFDRTATDAERLEVTADAEKVATLAQDERDWPTYRGGNERAASSPVAVPAQVVQLWRYAPKTAVQPTAPTAVGDLLFVAGQDGVVRALSTADGASRWSCLTAGPVRLPPTIQDGRAYVGSADGYVYCLEAASGRLLWRFRAAPVERRIMIYGSLASTWPVNSGVLVRDGVAYAAAGLIDSNGTYLYALSADTGKLKWQNNSSGQVDPELRKGVSVQGDLIVAEGKLVLAGGNQVSPAAFDLDTGRLLTTSKLTGRPRANRGQEVMLFRNRYVLLGGRLMYYPADRTVNNASFVLQGPERSFPLLDGRVPPAFDSNHFVFLDGQRGPFCSEPDRIEELYRNYTPPAATGGKFAIAGLAAEARKWNATQTTRGGTVSLALAANAALVVTEPPAEPGKSFLLALDLADGHVLWQQALPGPAFPDGLLVDRAGRVIVTLLDGSVVCYGARP